MATVQKQNKNAKQTKIQKLVSKGVSQAEAVRRANQAQKDKSLIRTQQDSGRAGAVGRLMAKLPTNTGHNPYLLTLLDPEATGPSDYPDMFSLKTAKAQFVFDKKVPINADGSFLVKVHPTLKKHVQMQGVLPAVSTTYDGGKQWDGPAKTTADGNQDLQPTIAGSFVDVMKPPIFQSRGNKDLKLQNDDQYVMLPTRSGSITVALNANVVNNFYFGSTALGDTSWQIVDLNGGTYTPSSGTATITSTTTLGFKIQIKSQLTDYLNSVSWALAITTQTGGVGLVDYDCTDFSSLDPQVNTQDIYEEYRVVSMGTLLSFHGDELTNGGDIASRYIEGGEDPYNLGWVDYGTLASAPQSYDGPLKLGTYCIWKPQCQEDMNFRDVESTNVEGNYPSIMIAGVQSSSLTGGQTTNLRLRVVMNVEAKTGRCYIPTSTSRVSIQEIEAANIALAGINLCMENPLHLQKIRDFIKGVYDKGKQAYSAIQPYMPYIKPLATAAGSALFPELAPVFAGAAGISSLLG